MDPLARDPIPDGILESGSGGVDSLVELNFGLADRSRNEMLPAQSFDLACPLGGISSVASGVFLDEGEDDDEDEDDEVGGRNILVPITNLCFSLATSGDGGDVAGLAASAASAAASPLLTNSMRPFSTMMLGGGAWCRPTTPWRIFNGIDDDLTSCDGELGAEREPVKSWCCWAGAVGLVLLACRRFIMADPPVRLWLVALLQPPEAESGRVNTSGTCWGSDRAMREILPADEVDPVVAADR